MIKVNEWGGCDVSTFFFLSLFSIFSTVSHTILFFSNFITNQLCFFLFFSINKGSTPQTICTSKILLLFFSSLTTQSNFHKILFGCCVKWNRLLVASLIDFFSFLPISLLFSVVAVANSAIIDTTSDHSRSIEDKLYRVLTWVPVGVECGDTKVHQVWVGRNLIVCSHFDDICFSVSLTLYCRFRLSELCNG